MSKYHVAVVGATGLVGQTILNILEERNFPLTELTALASDKSAGRPINYGGRSVLVQDIKDYDFSGVDLAFFTAGAAVSAQHAPRAAAAGAVVIDNTSHFRYQDEIPLIVPEVNAGELNNYRQLKIIANPNCATIQMLVALNPIYTAAGLRKIHVATYQSVSGAGQKGVDALANETVELLNGRGLPENDKFARQIAFNVLPQIDHFLENGYTKEEMKMVWETQKILGEPQIAVNATTVRVPVFYGHSEAVYCETENELSLPEIFALLENAPGVKLFPQMAEYPTALDVVDCDEVLVGRVRKDLFNPCGINMWVVADNVRKGAALNSVQIAEWLDQNYF